MGERIIPITMEEDSEESQDPGNSSQSSSAQDIVKTVEQLSLKNKPTVQVKKIQQKINSHEAYLKEFDVFEDRNSGEYTLPNANVPEKLVLVIDRAQDENYTSFMVDNTKYTPLSMLKRAIHLFIKLKHSISKYHEFAIVVLNENNVKWVQHFTTDTRKLKDAINAIDQCEVEDTFNLNSLFDEIIENVFMPDVFQPEIPPCFIIRVVIFYGRSYTIPTIEMTKCIKNLLDNPYFICDVLMTHEPVETGNYCNKIFAALQNVDKKGLAYFFPVGRDSRRLHNCMAKLLAHPLQRPLQRLQKT